MSEYISNLSQSPALVSVILLGLFCLKAVIMVIPMISLYITAGLLLPFEASLAVILTGMFCTMSITYSIGRRLNSDKVREFFMRKTNNHKAAVFLLKQRAPNNSVCFLARLSPLPFDLVSLYMGASGIKFSRYVVITFLGEAPVMIPYMFFGDAVLNPLSREFAIPFAIVMTVTVLTFAVYNSAAKRICKK
jgi:uncharacterized membrane protein YdjX (TVP38/TMEM64 family)